MRDQTPAACAAARPESEQPAGKPSWKDTLQLPHTSFPMRAGLASLEPELSDHWDKADLYASQRDAARPRFTLHDGPPYANGHLHMGHALNKVLKDMVVRSRQMSGFDAHFVPGWDCHGLPVEWKVEQAYREQGVSKEDVPVLTFRQACRDYAASWVSVQMGEFKRLGVNADWDHPYLTMDPQSEAAVAAEFLDFLMKGALYQKAKPVMWSPVEKTALAEAEVEYHDVTVTSAFLAYEVVSEGPLKGASLVAWTTTPWTVPASQGVAYGPTVDYGLYRVVAAAQESLVSRQLVLANAAANRCQEEMSVELAHVRDLAPADLDGLSLRHPLHRLDCYWSAPLPALPGEHVSADAGTGLVHTAPDHGDDDYRLGQAHGLPLLHLLGADGRLVEALPHFGGLEVVTQKGNFGPANAAVLEALQRCGSLLGTRQLVHSYPHSWRSRAPVLYRATPQWFVPVDQDMPHLGGKSLRQASLASLDEVSWHPVTGRNRLEAMLRSRPDWLLSRQRSWGVPLTLFTRNDLSPDDPCFVLRDEAVNRRVLAAFEEEGADAWYQSGAKVRFLGDDHDPQLYEQCFDVLDVWFESGTSHAFVLEGREDGPSDGVADLYLEGTDQHRGWFQASLLHSVATRGRAPFRQVVTHGFALDGKARKMAKSLGNVLSPVDLADEFGADVLRLWVAQSDYTKDFRASRDAFKGASETFRKLRNSLRFMLGALGDTDPSPALDEVELPLLERWLLHRARNVSFEVTHAYTRHDFARAVQVLHDFAAQDLSSVYFDARKDVLYCDAVDGPGRRAALASLSVCLDVCLSLVSPVLVFTAEDAWRKRHGSTDVHRQGFPVLPARLTAEEENRMERLLKLRDASNAALELARRRGDLSKPARARLEMSGVSDLSEEDALTLKALCLVADLDLVPGDVGAASAEAFPAAGTECPRCRTMTQAPNDEDLCHRCAEVLSAKG